jgi:predicted phosphoribosyltransferase
MRRAPLFADRVEAGRRLAAAIMHYDLFHPVVFALPRGGVTVAAEVAAALGAPLDLVLVRKLGVPAQSELAFGAVVDGGEAETVLNEDVVAAAGVTPGQISVARVRELAEIERRRETYLKGRVRPDPRGRDAIVIDDGLATGVTARAAIHALRRRGAARVILAVPVGAADSVEKMRREVDELICLEQPEPFFGIGAWYEDFHQLSDAEVVAMLDAATVSARPQPASTAG